MMYALHGARCELGGMFSSGMIGLDELHAMTMILIYIARETIATDNMPDGHEYYG